MFLSTDYEITRSLLHKLTKLYQVSYRLQEHGSATRTISFVQQMHIYKCNPFCVTRDHNVSYEIKQDLRWFANNVICHRFPMNFTRCWNMSKRWLKCNERGRGGGVTVLVSIVQHWQKRPIHSIWLYSSTSYSAGQKKAIFFEWNLWCHIEAASIQLFSLTFFFWEKVIRKISWPLFIQLKIDFIFILCMGL